jgi:hypothetical protein
VIWLTIAAATAGILLAIRGSQKSGMFGALAPFQEGGLDEALGCMGLAIVTGTAWIVYGLCKWGVL